MKRAGIALLLCLSLLPNLGFSNERIKEADKCNGVMYVFDVWIQDEDGKDRCFWNDGYLYLQDENVRGCKKFATLYIGKEYELIVDTECYDNELEVEPGKSLFDYYEVEYDKELIAVDVSPTNPNRFSVEVLKPCVNTPLTVKSTYNDMFRTVSVTAIV